MKHRPTYIRAKIYSTDFLHKNWGFILLFVLMLLFIPTAPVIEWLALKPQSKPLLIEPWRLLSGHFVHSNWTHLFLNLLNFLLLRLAFREWLSPLQFFSFVVYCALLVSIGLSYSTQLTSYVGFSGIIHGLLIYLLLFHWQKLPVIFSLITAFILGKVLYEQIYGAHPALENVIGAGVAVDAHAWGVVAALSFWFFEWRLKHTLATRKNT